MNAYQIFSGQVDLFGLTRSAVLLLQTLSVSSRLVGSWSDGSPWFDGVRVRVGVRVVV